MPKVPKTNAYACTYCPKSFGTAQGLHSHVMQTSCLARAGLLAESGPAAGSEDEVSTAHVENALDDDSDSDSAWVDPPPFSMPALPQGLARHSVTPEPEEFANPYRATVEEVEDEDSRWRYNEYYPTAAGTPLRPCQNSFEGFAEECRSAGHGQWYPFETEEEWLLAKWLMTSGLSQSKIDDHLKLNIIRNKANPSFHNTRALLQRIDALPTGPEWSCTSRVIKGDKLDAKNKPQTEEIEIWMRNPVDCIKELMENPTFKGKQCYEPRRVYRKDDGSNRELNEMWTADWWWEMQGRLPEGATVAPVGISTDKTALTRFTGDKYAWPVYITIGNNPKHLRRKPSQRAMILVGYIPVCKLDCFTKPKRQQQGYQLFHDSMKIILEPLIQAGLHGVEMACADGFSRLVYPILAFYIADYPEQCLVTCCMENRCPKCTVEAVDRNEYRVHSVLRDPQETLDLIDDQASGSNNPNFGAQGLRLVDPFWRNMPHCDIFDCIMPDLLHQLHKGVFKDHIVNWATLAMAGKEKSTRKNEVDERFKSMSPHPDLRHFSKGISLTTQWTGTEHKNMEKVFLGIIAGATDPQVILAVRGVLDFIYYAHFETHTDASLAQLDAAWLMFHENKDVFLDLDIREHFDINKLHNIKHYLDCIRSHGTCDGYNTEASERLHIDLAKQGYAASSKKNYYPQMCLWLQRQEAIHRFSIYLQWVVPGFRADAEECIPPRHVGSEELDESDDDAGYIDDDDDDDETPEPTPAVVHTVAVKPGLIGVTVSGLKADFGVDDIVGELNKFQGEAKRPARATEHTRFALYKRAGLLLPRIPEVGMEAVKDTVWAAKGEERKVTSKGIRRPVAARHSVVLIRTREAQPGLGPLSGLELGQIRAIFKLPEEMGSFRCPLVYVHWFKTLREPVPGLGMYLTSFSTRNSKQRASVVPLDQVVRSAHLMPVFGKNKALDLGWASPKVMGQATSFYLNPYLRHYDFYWLRFQVAKHQVLVDHRAQTLENSRQRGRHIAGRKRKRVE